MIGNITMIVPMSPSRKINTTMASHTGISGTIRWRHSWITRCLRVSRSAPHSTKANLASSLGWNWKGPPNEIQLRWPNTDTPMPGTNTRNRPTKAAIIR